MNRYESAKSVYEGLGVDVDAALEIVRKKAISIHCWQGDDVRGFENSGQALSGGIQATGDYPGAARNPEDLMADFAQAIALIPGQKRINLHASYAVVSDERRPVDRDALTVEDFRAWIDFAKEKNLGIDFNPTFFSHPMVKDGLTLSSPDERTRRFWVQHGIASRKIAAGIARELGQPVLNNIWIPDGYKDTPADRLGPRLRLKESLDEILEAKLDGVIDAVESKVFGIGLESYTVGSAEFYSAYCARRSNVYYLLDNGHFHPTEMVSDKISSMLTFFDYVPLHLTRPVRWDSDHVVSFDDETRAIMTEFVRSNALDRALIGLDFFDASINRIAAWVLGTRNAQKAMLYALLQPHDVMKRYQDEARFTDLLVLQEEIKSCPFGDIWAEYCRREAVPGDHEWLPIVKKYEESVLRQRNS